MGQGFGGFGMPEAALPNGGTMTPGSRPYNLALGATSQPKLPSPEMADATSPELGNSNVVSGAPNPSAVGSAGNPPSPGPSKAHKLLTILQSGLQGALAGRAADERAVAQSGGHRSGGFGGGFEAGFTLPWQRQQQQLGLQQQQAQIGALKAQSDLVQTPNGPIPGWLAKTVLPAQIHATATENAADTGAQGRIGAAQVTAGKPVVVPGRGLFQKDAQGKYQPVQGAEVPSVLVTPEEAQSLGHPELANQELDMQRYSSLLRGVSGQTATVQGAQGPATVNKITKKTQDLGLGNPGVASKMAGGVQIADPDNPGNTKFTTMGNAIKTGAAGPQSASVQIPKAMLKWATSGKGGDEVNAFNTALQHADLLEKAFTALQNGDMKALNSIKNEFKTQFGSADVTNFQTIANAYTREISKMLASGHMTNDEINTNGATLPPNASPDQFIGTINGYRSLAASKMQMRYDQFTKGMEGKPNFPAEAGGAKHKVGDSVTIKGKQVKITAVHPDGSFDAQ